MRLIILGALPPPRGGVSTHIERLIPYLYNEGIEFVIWDYSRVYKAENQIISLRRHPFKALLTIVGFRLKVLHHLLSTISLVRLLFFISLKVFRVKLIITFVGSWDHTIKKSYLKLFYVKVLTNICSHIVVSNKDFKEKLLSKGICKKNISVIPAFIPSTEKMLKSRPISKSAAEFCIRRDPLIITYAYGPDFYQQKDLYGLDMMVEVAQKLKRKWPQIGFVVVIPEVNNEKYFNLLRTNIINHGLESLFYFAIGNNFSFISFIKYADIFVRATNTDGDALTLREALYYGVTSIASDVCFRPEGTMLFRSRDAQDLYRVVYQTLDNNGVKQNKSKPQKCNNAQLFINIFKNAAGVED
jgi:glycosyltransferase involved in cell wall biosynthesis